MTNALIADTVKEETVYLLIRTIGSDMNGSCFMNIDDLWVVYEQGAEFPALLASIALFGCLGIGTLWGFVGGLRDGFGVLLMTLIGAVFGAVVGFFLGGGIYSFGSFDSKVELVQSVRDRALTDHDAYIAEEAIEVVIFGEDEEEEYYTIGGTFSGAVNGEEALISLEYNESTKSLDILEGDPGSGNPGTMESIFQKS